MGVDKTSRVVFNGSMKDALIKAVKAVGSTYKVAHALGYGQSRVSMWLTRGRVPAEDVLRLEQISGVSRHELRPDVFGKCPQSEAA